MAIGTSKKTPIIHDIANFDQNSGSIVERLLFNNRPIILFVCLVATIFFGYWATQVKLNASFQNMIPIHQPYIVNFLKNYGELQAQGNAVKVVVSANKGSIIDKNYLETLQKINDDVYLLPGVNRPFMTSLWTPSTEWIAVTADGLSSGPVLDQTYDGSAAQLAIVHDNIYRANLVGSMVGDDFKSSIIYMPLMETDNITGKPLNYGQFTRQLQQIEQKYASQGVTFHTSGYAVVLGDMIIGINKILIFFLISILIATAMLFWYTRCIRSTALVVTASLIAVVWQMGIEPLLGYDLTPYSVLVPFLVFAIGMSHGAQKMNGVMQDIGRGAHPLVAARFTFRRLFVAGFAALTCDMGSFAVLTLIRIEAIRELALIASIGVGILIFTNLIMLPMLLSYTGVSKSAAIRSMRSEPEDDVAVVPTHPLWKFLDLFTYRKYATLALAVSVVLAIGGWVVGRGVQIGDIYPGAPELRQSSQYNNDNSYILSHYSAGSDTLAVLVNTDPGYCDTVKTFQVIDDLDWKLAQLPMVQSTASAGSFAQSGVMLMTENSPKWFEIIPDQKSLDDFAHFIPHGLENNACTFDPIFVSLKDHRARTLTAVANTVEKFIVDPRNQAQNFKISLAGGNAGIDLATNLVIAQANNLMLLLVYAAVILFCFVAFRSWRAVVCAILPLMLTSILAQALMVVLGIGIKVATLPVIALGVGIGVDYALYVLSITLRHLRNGLTLSEAYYRTLLFTGRVVLLTGATLAIGVATWAFAPIKFQADMGILLAFMFLWNMLGTLILLPSLAYFLLPPRLFTKPI